MTKYEMAQAALTRARSGMSLANYTTIFEGFQEKGIPINEINPRENVLTYNAWRAVGRQVRKGEHGVQVCTWVEISVKDAETGESKPIGRRPRMTTVFHISQTEAIN